MRPLDQNLTVQTIAVGPPGRQGEPGTDGKQGLRGRQGLTGGKGDPGRQVIVTQGPPTPGDGNNGDIAIDVLNFEIYPAKTNGLWGEGVYFGLGTPDHEWDGTSLALYNADGTLGQFVELEGATGAVGPSGGPIPGGGSPGQFPTPLEGGGYGWVTPLTTSYANQLYRRARNWARAYGGR